MYISVPLSFYVRREMMQAFSNINMILLGLVIGMIWVLSRFKNSTRVIPVRLRARCGQDEPSRRSFRG